MNGWPVGLGLTDWCTTVNDRLNIRARAAFLQYMGYNPGQPGNSVWEGLKENAREHWRQVILASDASNREADDTKEVALDPPRPDNRVRCKGCGVPTNCSDGTCLVCSFYG